MDKTDISAAIAYQWIDLTTFNRKKKVAIGY